MWKNMVEPEKRIMAMQYSAKNGICLSDDWRKYAESLY
jgi:hypothetical protein